MLLLFQILVILEITLAVYWIHELVIDDHAVASDCGSISVLPL